MLAGVGQRPVAANLGPSKLAGKTPQNSCGAECGLDGETPQPAPGGADNPNRWTVQPEILAPNG